MLFCTFDTLLSCSHQLDCYLDNNALHIFEQTDIIASETNLNGNSYFRLLQESVYQVYRVHANKGISVAVG